MDERDGEGQHDEGVKEKVMELSVQSGVSSSFTAFIAVNKGNYEPIQGPLMRRAIPAPSECMSGQGAMFKTLKCMCDRRVWLVKKNNLLILYNVMLLEFAANLQDLYFLIFM